MQIEISIPDPLVPHILNSGNCLAIESDAR